MNILYVDCFAGISGDMTVAAFLDLGIPLEALKEALGRLALPHAAFGIGMETTERRGIRAARFTVQVGEHQPHRHYADIAGMIEGSALPENVKGTSQRIFSRLAEAEARVHGVEIGHVHFHEVGGIDSIIDIVATAFCLDYLGIEEVYGSSLPVGTGFVETAHGRLPVPAPATAELMLGMPVHFACGPGERVTPTGAAILAAIATGYGAPPEMKIRKIGCGAGSRDYDDMPNILRLFLGEKSEGDERDRVYVIETHIDDMNPEILGFLMERLFAYGALDVAFSPLQMKKNRPGTKLTIISPPAGLDDLARLVLNESTAAGLRYYPAERMMLARSHEDRDTSLGPVRVKVFHGEGKPQRVVPEFEECRRIAEKTGMPLLEVYRIIERDTSLP